MTVSAAAAPATTNTGPEVIRGPLFSGTIRAPKSNDATAMKGLVITLGVGQFCTQPGLIILTRSAAAEAFVAKLSALFTDCADGVMLTAGIHQAYQKGLTARAVS